jgi:hypothetical protein
MQEMRTSKIANQFIESLEFPISKDAILAAARGSSIDQTIQDWLGKIPDREYSDPEELTQALNAAT